MTEKIIGFLIFAIGVAGIVFGLALLFSLPFMWLWNWLMPVIFGLTKINVFQSLGLLLLSGLLMKSGSSRKSNPKKPPKPTQTIRV